eukprot:scaffold227592_cov36-Attheya_sp.AAC.1
MVVNKRSASVSPSALGMATFGPMNYCRPIGIGLAMPKCSLQIWTWSRWWRLRVSGFARERELHSVACCITLMPLKRWGRRRSGVA